MRHIAADRRRRASTGTRPSAGVAAAAPTARCAAESCRPPLGGFGELEPQDRLPVSGRSCGPAIDPSATPAAPGSMPGSSRSALEGTHLKFAFARTPWRPGLLRATAPASPLKKHSSLLLTLASVLTMNLTTRCGWTERLGLPHL